MKIEIYVIVCVRACVRVCVCVCTRVHACVCLDVQKRLFFFLASTNDLEII